MKDVTFYAEIPAHHTGKHATKSQDAFSRKYCEKVAQGKHATQRGLSVIVNTAGLVMVILCANVSRPYMLWT